MHSKTYLVLQMDLYKEHELISKPLLDYFQDTWKYKANKIPPPHQVHNKFMELLWFD